MRHRPIYYIPSRWTEPYRLRLLALVTAATDPGARAEAMARAKRVMIYLRHREERDARQRRHRG